MNSFVEQGMTDTHFGDIPNLKGDEDNRLKLSAAHSNRAIFSDKEYIEYLEKENARLRKRLERQNKLIEALNGSLEGHNGRLKGSNSDVEDNNGTQDQNVGLEVPQRSAKRNVGRSIPDAAQETPTRKLRSSSFNIEGTPKSQPLRSLLAGDNHLQTYSESEGQLVKEEANVGNLDPKISNRGAKTAINDDNRLAVPRMTERTNEKSSAVEEGVNQSRHSGVEKSITNPFTEDSSALSLLSGSVQGSNERAANGNGGEENMPSRPSKFERLAMLKNSDNEESRKIEQSSLKEGNNNSSGTSYKSRIRLPPTLQNNSNQSLGSNKSEDISALGIITPSLTNKDNNVSKSLNPSQTSFIKSASSQSQFATPLLDSDAFVKTPIQKQYGFGDTTPGNFGQSDTLRVDTKAVINDANELSSTVSSRSPSTSFNVFQSPLVEDTSSFLINPEEFHTVTIKMVSTLHLQSPGLSSPLKRQEEGIAIISINDKESGKDMWRIRKKYTQLLSLDSSIRPIVEYFGLPYIPERLMFTSTAPAKIAHRKNILQDYFDAILSMPHMPQSVSFRMCQFLSEDLVNPLDDFKSGARKEGYLVRRHKGIGISWKVKWCQVDGPYLEIYEFPGGPFSELIKLTGSQIGKQTGDSVAEDKGYRHAFLVVDSQKKLGSLSKHIFCAESDEERDDWILALLEFSEDSNVNDDALCVHGSLWSENTLKPNEADSSDGYQKRQTISLLSPTKATLNSNDNSGEKSSQKDLKEQKRMKKRSIFPFKGLLNFLGDIPQPDTTLSSSTQNKSSQNGKIESENPGIQTYLDQMNLDDNIAKAIFGRELEVAYNLSTHEFMGKKIPSVCYRCLDFLISTGGVEVEGIFRLSGSASVIRQLKENFNNNFDLDLFESTLNPDIHTIAGLFKTYLRELPTCILGLQMHRQLKEVVTVNSELPQSSFALSFKEHMQNFKKFNEVNYNVSYVIFKFLNYVILQSSRNKMNLRNICIVFVPTLNISLDILSTFLIDFDCIFEGGMPVSDEKREVLDLYIPDF